MKRIFVLLLSVFILVSLACQFSSPLPNAAPTEPKPVSTSKGPAPSPEVPTAKAAPASTDAPVAEATQEKSTPTVKSTSPSGDYHEEFDTEVKDITEFKSNYPNWKDSTDPLFPFIITGNAQHNAKFFVQGGALVVKLAGHEETQMKIYENDHNFKDVVVSTEIENFGASHDKVALLSRINKMGWYEFQIGSDGHYWVYRYDTSLKAQGKNPYVLIVDDRSSTLIHSGNKKNTFSMSCIGDQFKFTINDTELTDDQMNIPHSRLEEFKKYTEGTTGLGIYSLPDTPGDVEVHFSYFDAKAAQQ